MAAQKSFVAKLEQRWQKELFVCVGLDTEYSKLPESVKVGRSLEEAIVAFNREIISTTHDLVCAYKPNSAFYEAYGEEGWRALQRTIDFIHEIDSELPIILDAKRGDNSNTNGRYVMAAFDTLGVDAITVHPYLGKEALEPFLKRADKGIIVLAKTSNPGSGEFQDLLVGEERRPLYQVIAKQVAEEWNGAGNCALVVGATYPEELRQVRELVGDMPLLIPGLGTQGGEVAATVRAGRDSRGWGMILNTSRGVLYASDQADFAQVAQKGVEVLTDEISLYNRER